MFSHPGLQLKRTLPQEGWAQGGLLTMWKVTDQSSMLSHRTGSSLGFRAASARSVTLSYHFLGRHHKNGSALCSDRRSHQRPSLNVAPRCRSRRLRTDTVASGALLRSACAALTTTHQALGRLLRTGSNVPPRGCVSPQHNCTPCWAGPRACSPSDLGLERPGPDTLHPPREGPLLRLPARMEWRDSSFTTTTCL